MDLKTLFATCQSLDILEEREISPDFIDAVFYSKDEQTWAERISGHLGPALKSAGEKASSEAKKIAKAFGGIRTEQTMFRKDFENITVVAMFWPWVNGKQTTLKIFKIEKADQPDPKKKFLFF